MDTVIKSTGQVISLEPSDLLGTGGEARVFAVSGTNLVAKVYHTPSIEKARKLKVMLANAPDDPMAVYGRVSIAWPVDLLCSSDQRDRVVGFLMPLIRGMNPAIEFYNPRTRRQRCPLFSYHYLHRTARNLASAVAAVHARGYVIGDVNESNVLVNELALATLVDTDSFQVRDPEDGFVYRCPVGKAEFTPPEMQDRSFAEQTRLPEHDAFGLAVLIFQLLMEGTHPFAGVYQGPDEPPAYGERITAGHFPYRSGETLYAPMPLAPPLEILAPPLRELFTCCFVTGHQEPARRPGAEQWRQALAEAEKALRWCERNPQHLFGDHLPECPWCRRSEQLGIDPFPSVEEVRAKRAAAAAALDLSVVEPEPVEALHQARLWTAGILPLVGMIVGWALSLAATTGLYFLGTFKNFDVFRMLSLSILGAAAGFLYGKKLAAEVDNVHSTRGKTIAVAMHKLATKLKLII